jgi:hypothetical protein
LAAPGAFPSNSCLAFNVLWSTLLTNSNRSLNRYCCGHSCSRRFDRCGYSCSHDINQHSSRYDNFWGWRGEPCCIQNAETNARTYRV